MNISILTVGVKHSIDCESCESMEYSLCESLINSFEVPKSGKTTTAQLINKSLKKRHRYIYWLYHWVCKNHGSPVPSVGQGNSRSKRLLVKISDQKQ